ncbi:adenylate/guanylate cyclase domain-containing protein [Dongia sp.]|uniref:adenylate/guanylate cyclase domain-containing protein n=1 Tax=Dongia sp. TaxID=1977262 RepID=UPI0035AECD17
MSNAHPLGTTPAKGLSARLALGLLMAAGCFLIAGLVHFNWQRSADRNAAELVTQINSRITSSVTRDIKSKIDSAESALASLHTVFFQDVIRINNEAKREFVFLSLLQSNADLTWVSFAWPDGSFFGARKDADNNIRMIEVKRDTAQSDNFRIDNYLTTDHDILFQSRSQTPSSFDATQQPWYDAAQSRDGTVWTESRAFPTGDHPAITISRKLTLYGRYIGVLAVSIDLSRLARFIDRLEITQRGQAIILGPDGQILGEHGWEPLNDVHDSGRRAIAAARDAQPEHLTNIVAPVSLMGRDPLTERDYYLNISRLPYQGWSLVIAIPTTDILGDIPAAIRRLYVIVAVLAALVATGAFIAADRLVTRPLAGIAKQLKLIGGFDLHAVNYEHSFLREFDQLSRSLVQMSAGLGSFQKYLPADLVRTLVSEGIEAKLGGQRRQLTLLFSDLAGFTGLTESDPERMVAFLGAHLDDMSQAIHATGGTIDKFIGDSVMAFWNAPAPHETPEVAACRAALACRDRFNRMLKDNAWGLVATPGLRIGINTGPALVGNIGSHDRLNYTAIGDTVNLASRLEALNKQYGTGILVGADTVGVLGNAFILRKLDRVAVYGRKQGVEVYELVAEASEDSAGLDWIGLYESGLDAYFERDWQRAEALFHMAADSRGGDRPSAILAERCREYHRAPPPDSWAGIALAMSK